MTDGPYFKLGFTMQPQEQYLKHVRHKIGWLSLIIPMLLLHLAGGMEKRKARDFKFPGHFCYRNPLLFNHAHVRVHV
jgi:hypothetical protein